MADTETNIERRLRQAGAEFVQAHDNADIAIREAASMGIPPDTIAHVSGLSPETVRAFLREPGSG